MLPYQKCASATRQRSWPPFAILEQRVMGTNYYWREKKAPCPTCGHNSSEELHIGKSSGGWCFSLHVDPELGINDLPDWIERWHRTDSCIRDEYGRDVTPAEMWAVVMCRWNNRGAQEPEWYARNGGHLGPFGLARHIHHATPGDGPYDLCRGEFS
jgi:hypothetical protein